MIKLTKTDPLSEDQEEALDAYILAHSDPESDYLHRLYRATNIHTVHGRMASGHLQGRVLKMLVTMIKPKNILEVGTFSGYEMEDFTRQWLEGSAVTDRINFIIGDANIKAPRLGITFDMVFIDGDKRTYLDTYEMALSILRPGGYILADNTLWDGHVIDRSYDNDRQTSGIERFNDFVATDRRVERVILPLRDGLTIIRKL